MTEGRTSSITSEVQKMVSNTMVGQARGGNSKKFEPIKKLSLNGEVKNDTAATKLDSFKDKTNKGSNVGGFVVLDNSASVAAAVEKSTPGKSNKIK